jgi:hypothetical protein
MSGTVVLGQMVWVPVMVGAADEPALENWTVSGGSPCGGVAVARATGGVLPTSAMRCTSPSVMSG